MGQVTKLSVTIGKQMPLIGHLLRGSDAKDSTLGLGTSRKIAPKGPKFWMINLSHARSYKITILRSLQLVQNKQNNMIKLINDVCFGSMDAAGDLVNDLQ